MVNTKDFREYMLASRLSNIDRIVLVGSGKGGVGKSTITAMLALRLRDMGAGVGILDVDLHGSSIPCILGMDNATKVEATRGGFKPAEVHGVKVMSLKLFVGNEPVPLRGERKGEVIKYLLSFTLWGRLSYLIVDLPPGMGDELLTLVKYLKGHHLLVTMPSRTSLDVTARYLRFLERLGCDVRVVVVNNLLNVKLDESLLGQYLGGSTGYIVVPFIHDVELMLARGVAPDSALGSIDELIRYIG